MILPTNDGNENPFNFEIAGEVKPDDLNILTITTTGDPGPGACTAGLCSLRDAITFAKEEPGDDLIVFADNVTGTINLTSQLPELRGNITIDGPGSSLLTVHRTTQDEFRIFTVAENAVVEINGLTIKDGHEVEGGGIFNDGTLSINGVHVSDNHANDAGGGIINWGTLRIRDSDIFRNTVLANADQKGGGGIANIGGEFPDDSRGSLSIIGSEFYANTADNIGLGGGLSNSSNANATISSTSFGEPFVFDRRFEDPDDSENGNQAFKGGAIYNNGAMTLFGSTSVIGNSATASGGGIFNDVIGDLNIENGRISYNDGAMGGGGIINLGALMIEDVTLAGNATEEGPGGAIWNQPTGTVTTRNVTMSRNESAGPGGAIRNLGEVTLESNSIYQNNATSGGGISTATDATDATTEIANTILAGNTADKFPEFDGILRSNDYNLVQNLIEDFSMVPPSPTFITGIENHNIYFKDAELGPLQNNGRGLPTHRLLDGSPAIDAGNTDLSTDQRGAMRLGIDDIGAFELVLNNALIVTSTADTEDIECTVEDCTLRAAINAANLNTGDDIIEFSAGVTGTIDLQSALPFLVTPLVIDGPGADLLTVRRDSSNLFRIFDVGIDATVAINGLTVQDGHGITGGGITNRGTLTVRDSTIVDNIADVQGGGILNTANGTLFVIDSHLYRNRADVLGGGISNLGSGDETGGGNVIIRNTVIGNSDLTSGNQAENGGGVHNGGTMVIDSSDVVGNSAGSGGGITNDGEFILFDASVTDNTAVALGGGFNNRSSLHIVNSTLAANQVTDGVGGALYNDSSSEVTLVNSTLSGNQSEGSGGGIHNRGTVSVDNSTIHANSTTSSGGGIFTLTAASTTLGHTIVAGNMAPSGPDLFGTIDSKDYNLIQDTSDATIDGDSLHNVTGQDPLLGPLQDNGGPTMTHALLVGSPAIGAGDPAFDSLLSDQRGMPRISSSH